MSSNGNHWLKAQKHAAAGPLRQLRLIAPLTGILVVAQAWLLAHVIDSVAFREAGLDTVLPAMLTLLPVFLLRFLANWRSAQLGVEAALLIKREVRTRLFEKLRRLGPVALQDDSSGAIAAQVVDGVEALDGYFGRYVPAMILVSAVPLIILLTVFPSDWISGLVLIVTAPLIPLFMILIGKSAERQNQAQWEKLSRMGSHFLNVLQTLPTLKAFNASRRELDNIARISDAFRRTTMSVLRLAFLTSAVLEFFAAISIALIAVFIGFRLLDGEMAFFYGFFVLLLAPEFYLPLRNFGVQNHARMEAAAAAGQLAEILERPEYEPAGDSTPRTGFQGALSIRDVHFSYETGREAALCGLHLRIAPGEHVAIVGPSGAGKSTLANLLLGFVPPDSGEVRVGNIKLEPANIRAWRRQIGWIPQRAHLFHGSVIENIRLGAPDASLNQVLEACEAANALDFIDALPQGLETLVGEGGQGLSGGQIQRIAIARALVRNTPWLLLDEPSAHLDAESERLVTEALAAVSRRRTLISIAHRLQTVRHADRIIVLQNGRVVQEGTFDALENNPGTFRDLILAGEEISA